MKMETRNLMVSILAIFAMTLALTAGVAAHDLNVTPVVYINGVVADGTNAVYPGDTISVKVVFTANEDFNEVEVKAEIEGASDDVSTKVYVGKVLAGKIYTKTMSLKVPYDLKDDPSEDAILVVTIEDGDNEELVSDFDLTVQRTPFDASIMSVNVPQTVDAGALVPVDVVIKNKGMENLDDLYVKAKISALGVERTVYFGDIVSFEANEEDDDATDTVSGRLFLQVPDNAKPGTYTVEVEVLNTDTSSTGVAQIVVQNDLAGNNVIVTEASKNVAVGEDAVYNVLIVNPSNKLKVYRVVPEASTDLTVKVSDAVVAVPAGSSKTITVTTSSATEGKFAINVNVLAGEDLVQKVALTTDAQGAKKTSVSNPIVILTIVLAVIFVVLLIVLITLLGKKPSKNEEFGESYY